MKSEPEVREALALFGEHYCACGNDERAGASRMMIDDLKIMDVLKWCLGNEDETFTALLTDLRNELHPSVQQP